MLKRFGQVFFIVYILVCSFFSFALSLSAFFNNSNFELLVAWIIFLHPFVIWGVWYILKGENLFEYILKLYE